MVLPADRRTAPAQSKKQKAKKPTAADSEASRLGDGERARLPPSTCISSPLRATARKRKAQAHRESLILDEVDEESEDDIQPHHALHASGYMRDGFVVEDDEESDDAFDPPRPPARLPRRRQQTLEELGPPISRDARFDEAGLSEIHQDIIEDFVERAKRLEEDLRNRKDMRRTIFTDQQFREMAIRWTTSVTKMRSIPGIDVDKVNTFGAKFVPLVKQYHDQYREMMGDAAEPAPPPASSYTTTRTVSGNHDIVDLLSSDDEQMEGEFEDDEDDEDDLESSRYFGGPNAQPPGESSEVQDFYREFERLNSQPASKKGASSSSRGSTTSWRGGGGKRGFRKGGRGGARGSGGVTKRKASGSRRSSGGTSSAGGRSRGGGSARPSGGSGISLMPM